MRGRHHDRILASTALSLMLAAPLGAFAQNSNEPTATFNEAVEAGNANAAMALGATYDPSRVSEFCRKTVRVP